MHVRLSVVGYCSPIGNKQPDGLETYITRYGICPVQCLTMAQHIRNSNIVRGGSHLQTQFYLTLCTFRWLLLMLIHDQSFLYTLTLQSITLHLMWMHAFALVFGCGDVIYSRFVRVTLWRLSSIYKPRVLCYGNAQKIELLLWQASGSNLYLHDLIAGIAWSATTWMGVYIVFGFSLFVIGFGHYLRFQAETERGSIECYRLLALTLTICAQSVCVALLTMWTLG